MNFLRAAGRGTRLMWAHATGAAIPFHVTAYVTTHCNLRCVYCASPYQREHEMTAAEWCGVLAELRGLGTERVLFFGGEPLVREDLGTIVSAARDLGLRCAMASNGTLVPRRRDVVAMLHTLVLSLDGSRESHDRARGEGNHEEVLTAIEVARSLGVAVKANAVLSQANADDLDWLLSFSARARVPLTLNVMRSEENGLWHEAVTQRMDDDSVRALIDRIIAAKRTNPYVLLSSATYRTTRRWQDFSVDRLSVADGGDAFGGPRCSAGRFHCAIYSDGRLFPCTVTATRVPALNVRTSGVAAALATAGRHGCATCFSPCMQEVNGLFALRPAVVANLVRTYVGSRLE